jgi:hypothetical protein
VRIRSRNFSVTAILSTILSNCRNLYNLWRSNCAATTNTRT